ncbi:nitroreductase [Ottowia sp. GY511]|uniref:Putative NAD(P)H nitroreductase n=1 Tax=Ottowia flava TaxID=2675430 RepID=A0ABW4KQB7_9BURK|nr:nitroreductase family protein [Ottowia sp. GY511]TXK29697.1 nitroreductase [Ottowia sp. GY511]
MADPEPMADPAEASVVAEPRALGDPRPPEVVELTHALIHSRQTILPKRLGEPGPDAAQTQQILAAAAQAPDHHALTPWRFVLVPAAARPALAEAFADALTERDAEATPEQLAQAREKAFRAPLVLLAVARLRDADAEIEPHERIVSAGCAVQNMLLMAHAQGFGGALTSGKALASAPLRRLFALTEDEQALCFVNIGTVLKGKRARVRPHVADYVSALSGR